MDPDPAHADPVTRAALQSLKDIALPDPVSWIPHTWGWALLGAILLGGLLTGLVLQVRRYRADAYRREALKMLADAELRLRDPQTREQAIHEVAAILKRTALAAWPREKVANLCGEAWVDFLDEHGGDDTGHALERLLNDFEYHDAATLGGLPPSAADEIARAAGKWIERHHVPA